MGNLDIAQICILLFLSRDREERLAALSAAQQEAMEELQKKIQMKVSSQYFTNGHSTNIQFLIRASVFYLVYSIAWWKQP